jgi:hypothetical protein
MERSNETVRGGRELPGVADLRAYVKRALSRKLPLLHLKGRSASAI